MDQELIEAADALAQLLEAGRALDHPDHANLIQPITRKVRVLMAKYFRRQGREMVSAIRAREADPGERQAITDHWLASVAPLAMSYTVEEDQDYRNLIQDAIRKAEAQLAKELESAAVIPETVMSRYLGNRALSKLTGNFAETTKQALRDAIQEAVQAGGTADDIVRAIRDTMRGFSSVRAELIAQTEVNDAYNFGRMEMAKSADMTQKHWVTESGDPCDICLANEDEGWIEITGLFSSGDSMPTAHPRCYCSLDFRLVTL